MSQKPAKRLKDALWRVYQRADRPDAWAGGGNLPWNDPDFAERMLREHLDESHGAASRRTAERAAQIDWLWKRLALAPGARVYDVTCGPGLYAVELARRGCVVTGVDFSPASIRHARTLARENDLAERCTFIESDIRSVELDAPPFDAALFLYGQLAVFPRNVAAEITHAMCDALAPGGTLVVELLAPENVDKEQSTWWFTDDTGLWGDEPFLHLGERFWNEDTGISTERFHVVHLETGEMQEVVLSDQTYSIDAARDLLLEAGFAHVDVHPSWGDVSLYDACEWTVYVATKAA